MNVEGALFEPCGGDLRGPLRRLQVTKLLGIHVEMHLLLVVRKQVDLLALACFLGVLV